jgi:hypothetical protein
MLQKIGNTLVSIPRNLTREEMYRLDVWDLTRFRLKPSRDGERVVNFSYITQPWLKEATKQWLRYFITREITESTSTIISRLISLIHFSKYLKLYYLGLQPQYIDRDLVAKFWSHLICQNLSDETMNECL